MRGRSSPMSAFTRSSTRVATAWRLPACRASALALRAIRSTSPPSMPCAAVASGAPFISARRPRAKRPSKPWSWLPSSSFMRCTPCSNTGSPTTPHVSSSRRRSRSSAVTLRFLARIFLYLCRPLEVAMVARRCRRSNRPSCGSVGSLGLRHAAIAVEDTGDRLLPEIPAELQASVGKNGHVDDGDARSVGGGAGRGRDRLAHPPPLGIVRMCQALHEPRPPLHHELHLTPLPPPRPRLW